MPFVPPFLCRLVGIKAGTGTKMSIQSVRSARRGHHAIGDECILHNVFSFDRPDAKIIVGQRSFIGKSHLVAAERIEVGDDVIISWGTTIVDHNSHATGWPDRKADVADWHQGKKDWSNITIAPVKIEDNVYWLQRHHSEGRYDRQGIGRWRRIRGNKRRGTLHYGRRQSCKGNRREIYQRVEHRAPAIYDIVRTAVFGANLRNSVRSLYFTHPFD
ncbi:hypothetical protein IQ26_07450 [Mesorhizobium tianshanense]|uniref:Transferase family hexapeptide repeat protein n=1 Tax=Mesorhizobium tianshanense TaxID=39844 RepID=A0A562MD35_9HYPH|nr:hypothetical protein IQ26_07450 [Mesorhizobium tianshanense]